MPKQSEKLTLDRVFERSIIDRFLSDNNIQEEPDWSQSYPDCIIPTAGMAIEETSVRFFKIIKTSTLIKQANEWQKEEAIEYNHPRHNILIEEVRKAIKEKDCKKNYEKLLQYEKRVLIVRINGIGFDWRNFEKIACPSYFSDLKLHIFNSAYLVIHPVTPTQNDIANNKTPPLKPNFVQIIGLIAQLEKYLPFT